MQLTILGGGGFRVPLVFGAVLRQRPKLIREVVLYDVDAARLRAIEVVLQQLSRPHQQAPVVRATTDLDAALGGATFVFCAIRVGGLLGRVYDEQVPLDLGVVGQETTGPGGIAYGLRTVPVAIRLAQRIATRCPQAWVINFTNPAGMVTEAMQHVLGDRVIGICDSPTGLVRRAARACRVETGTVAPDYVGLNHLGWLQGLWTDDGDLLPDLLADDGRLLEIEEVRLMGTAWVRTLGALPNEYLYYYYFTREAIAAAKRSSQTRAAFLLDQQEAFFARAVADPQNALPEWEHVRRERSASYMAENRALTRAPDRAVEDVDDPGYEGVAADIISAIAADQQASLILNVRNGSTIAELPPEAVVEVPCVIDAAGARAATISPPSLHMTGLMAQMKAVEQLTIRAATSGSRSIAHAALALHPLVDSAAIAGALLDGYRQRLPDIAALLTKS